MPAGGAGASAASTSIQSTSIQATSIQATSIQAASMQATSIQATSIQAEGLQGDELGSTLSYYDYPELSYVPSMSSDILTLTLKHLRSGISSAAEPLHDHDVSQRLTTLANFLIITSAHAIIGPDNIAASFATQPAPTDDAAFGDVSGGGIDNKTINSPNHTPQITLSPNLSLVA